MADDNALLHIVKTARVNGKSFLDIERLYDIPAAKAESIYNSYYRQLAATKDPVVERMVQLERLEAQIDILNSMAQMGNIKSSEVLGRHLEQINTLLGLSLETQKIEVRVISEQQSTVVYNVVENISKTLLGLVQEKVSDRTELALIEEAWDERLADSFKDASENIIEAEMVEL